MAEVYLELVVASFIFGSTGVFVKILHLPPTTLTFFRLAIPTLALFLYLFIKRVRLFRGKNGWMLIASTINAVRSLLFFIAYTFTTISNATLAGSIGPVFIFIYSAIFFKEKITPFKSLLLVMAIAGVFILYSNQPITLSNKDFLGMSLALLSTALYNLTIIIFKKESLKYSPPETIFYQNLLGTFLFLPFLFINKPFPALWQLSLVSFSSFLIGVVGFALYFSALKKVSAAGVSLATFDSVVAVCFGVLIFKEHLTANMIIGGTLILLASFLTRKAFD